MTVLSLTLPFMVRDLIAPEVLVSMYPSIYCDIPVKAQLICVYTGMYQITLINAAIDDVKAGSCLHSLPHILLIPEARWLVSSFRTGISLLAGSLLASIPESELPEQKAVALFDLQQRNLPDKTGERAKRSFEKAHSLPHEVREIVLWGNAYNASCPAPEVCTGKLVYACRQLQHAS